MVWTDKFCLGVRSRHPRRSQSARSRGVSLLPRFARETTHAASYWAMEGHQVLSRRSVAAPTSLAVRSLPRREPPPSLCSGDYSRRELLGDGGPSSSVSAFDRGSHVARSPLAPAA